jgi:hypothetical protein
MSFQTTMNGRTRGSLEANRVVIQDSPGVVLPHLISAILHSLSETIISRHLYKE